MEIKDSQQPSAFMNKFDVKIAHQASIGRQALNKYKTSLQQDMPDIKNKKEE